MKQFVFLLSLFAVINLSAQNKKPLDHTVYDGWKSLGERMISNDGKFIVYAVNPQEGDGELVIQNKETIYKSVIARGNGALISDDSRYVFFKIKPIFQETRQARIKKKKPDEMQKDSLGIVELGSDSVIKIPRVKSFKAPEKASGWIAYLLEKPLPDSAKKKMSDSLKAKTDMLIKLADSVIRKSIDSIKGKIEREELIGVAQKAAKEIIKKGTEDALTDAEGDDATTVTTTEGTDLVLRRMSDAKEKTFKLVSEYYFNKTGTRLFIETTKNLKDTNSKALVLLYDLRSQRTDTILKGCNDCKSYALDEEGNQLAFIAERDSSAKALRKFYKLWYYKAGDDSARLLVEKNSVGMVLGSTVSENGTVVFSKD